MIMYGIPIYTLRRSNITASLLIPIMAISILTMGLTVTSISQTAPATPQLTKISSALLNEIITKGDAPVNVLIETYTSAYESLVGDITELGGKVSHQFKYVDALAATLPADKIAILVNNNLNVKKIYLDQERTMSSDALGVNDLDQILREESPINFPADDALLISLTPEQIALIEPNTYWNPVAMGALDVWAKGIMGQGSLAVIIDTGVYDAHFMLSPLPGLPPTVIGGIDMSDDVGTPYEGWNAPTNHWHGTHVAGILAGHGAILVHSSHPLYGAISRYAIPPMEASSLGYPGYHVIPLTGLAPLAQIYAIKVFAHTGAGVPESYIIAAIEHAIDLKVTGVYDVDIISMSLGGGTGYDGRDLEALTVDHATSEGITVVSAAGNEGPAPMTVASPGEVNSGIGVAAAAHPVNTRVFWDYRYGIPGIGHQLFVSDIPQIYAFSSRGPTSDGRAKPDVAATGLFVLSAYIEYPVLQALAFASGTSMSTPAVSGGVALLNSYAEMSIPAATPTDYKQAIMGGAVWLDGYTVEDQGAGYLNAGGALSALMADPSIGDLPAPLPPEPSVPVDITNIPIVGSGEYTDSITDLAPGFKIDYVFETTVLTDSITVEVTNFDTERDPYGLNNFEVYIQSAVRTGYDYFIDSANVFGDAIFYVKDYETTWVGATWVLFPFGDYSSHKIQPGYMRIVLENDWTSSGPVSGDIKITVTERATLPTPDLEFSGKVKNERWITPGYFTKKKEGGFIYPPTGTTKVVIELWWKNDWTKYPTSDLDLYILWNDGVETYMNFDGATLRSPEGVVIENPTIAWIRIYIYAYSVYTPKQEPWTLKIFYSS